MSLPTVTSVSPQDGTTGIILGTPIIVTFSALMDHTTFTGGSFALLAPSSTEIITPQEEIQNIPKPTKAKQNVPGTFSFDDTAGYTVMTFTPSIVLQPNGCYRIVLMGTGSLISQTIKDTSGNVLDQSYGWSFTTGILNLSLPPVQSPIITARPDIDPCSIIVTPRKFVIGQDLTQQITLVFPGVIDQTSFTTSEILLSIEAILGDPTIVIPPGLETNLTIEGNTMTINITGW